MLSVSSTRQSNSFPRLGWGRPVPLLGQLGWRAGSDPDARTGELAVFFSADLGNSHNQGFAGQDDGRDRAPPPPKPQTPFPRTGNYQTEIGNFSF